MWLAGIPVADEHVVELVGRLRDADLHPTADHLQRTLDRGARIVALDGNDRHAILRVLEERPDELLELRATLIQEAVWRKSEGLRSNCACGLAPPLEVLRDRRRHRCHCVIAVG